MTGGLRRQTGRLGGVSEFRYTRRDPFPPSVPALPPPPGYLSFFERKSGGGDRGSKEKEEVKQVLFP